MCKQCLLDPVVPLVAPRFADRLKRWLPFLFPRMLERAEQPIECLPCGMAKIYSWLFLHWWGYPLPMRDLRKEYAGCGCHYRTKQAWLYVQWWWNYNKYWRFA